VLFVFGPPVGVFGVGHNPVAPVKLSVAPGWFPALSESSERGVGHIALACCSRPGGLLSPPSAAGRIALSLLVFVVCGVLQPVPSAGEDEEPFALVRGADFRRREEAFRDAVAKAFEVGANNVEVSEPKVSAHVLEEAPIWLTLSDDSGDGRPEVAGVCGSEAFAGDTERLAGVSANDASHLSTPRAAVEGVQISPDRRVIQGTVRNTRCQDFAGSDFVFQVANCASAWQSQSDSKVESPGSTTEAEDGM